MLNSVAFLRDLWKSHKNPIKIPFFSGPNCLLYPGFDSFFYPDGKTDFLNFFHISNSIRPCVQNYCFTLEIEIDKQLKNNEV